MWGDLMTRRGEDSNWRAVGRVHYTRAPAAAAPGYDLYFFNVMAGPKREWLITDDPNQAWVRKTWETKSSDTRLPYKED